MCDQLVWIITIYLCLQVIAVILHIIVSLIVAAIEWLRDIKWEFDRRKKK